MDPVIDVRGVTKTYRIGDLEVHALRGIDLAVERGEFVAIMGASGSGKSTLMNVIGCLDQPTLGTYRLEGIDVASLDEPALARIRSRRIGFVFQSFNLLQRTSALENVELPLVYAGMPARERHARAREALERVGLGDRTHHHPNQLSGGQQQRVAIARAIVTRPHILLADEPTGALDSTTSVEVMALLQELGREGLTVVLVTHENDVAEFASRLVVLRDGLVRSDERRVARVARPGPAPAPAPAEVLP